MYKKYHIPVAIQRFIIRDRLTRDTDTLAFCGVTPESAVKIYLYLKPLDECFTSHDAQTRDEEFLEETPVLNQHLPFTGKVFIPKFLYSTVPDPNTYIIKDQRHLFDLGMNS